MSETLDRCPKCGGVFIRRWGVQKVSITEVVSDEDIVDYEIEDWGTRIDMWSAECLKCGHEWSINYVL